MRHFEWDCKMPDYRLLKKKSIGNAKQNRDQDDSPRPRSYNYQ